MKTHAWIALLVLAACASQSRTDWDHIDYERIARQNQQLDNDSNYTPPQPTVVGCVDDDLYNCNPPSGVRQ